MEKLLESQTLLQCFASPDYLAILKHFMAMNDYSYSFDGGFVLNNPQKTEESLESELRQWLIQKRQDLKSQTPPIKTGPYDANRSIKDAIRTYKDLKYQEALNEIKKKLKFDSSLETKGFDELSKFITSLTGQSYGEKFELDRAVIYGFIWMIKRHIYNGKIEWPVVPILYAKQGAGKTETVKRLCLKSDAITNSNGLLSPFFLSLSKDSVVDERNRSVFATKYIILADEIELPKESYGDVKSLITSETISWRPMRTNEMVEKKKTASLIGTSNFPIESIIFDTTGVRRFYQVDVQSFESSVESNIQQTEMENIDYVSIWKAVDESLPYKDTVQAQYKDQLLAVAEEKRNKTDFELFLEDSGYRKLSNGEKGTFVKTKVMYDDFKIWAKSNCNYNHPVNTFKRKFIECGIDFKRSNGFDGYFVGFTDNTEGMIQQSRSNSTIEQKIKEERYELI
jgi:hypothetical protein